MGGGDIWVAGVDGCRAGWIVVLRPLDAAGEAVSVLVKSFEAVLALPGNPALIAVDMPIGLPDESGIGGRPADVAARAHLGARQSAVFAVPSRAAVLEEDYRRSCEVAFATSRPPRKVSKQCFHLFPKIREIDRVMTPALQERVVECHPELAFWALNGETALTEPKKVKSRPWPAGLDLRRGLLVRAGYSEAFVAGHGYRNSDVGTDDLLDASACAASAARIFRGSGRRFPPDPPRDAKGLRMEIWG